MQRNRLLTVGALISELKEHFLENSELTDAGWCMYTAEDILSSDTACCIADAVTITDDDEEIYPAYAAEHNMDFCVYDELIHDVISAYLSQKADAETDELVEALNYYLEHDCFLSPDGGTENPYQHPQVILAKAPDKKVMLKIKKVFGISQPLGEFLAMAEHTPCILTDSLTLAEAKKLIEENDLAQWVAVK